MKENSAPVEETCLISFTKACNSCFSTQFVNVCANQIRANLPASLWIKDVNTLPSFWVYFVGIFSVALFWGTTLFFCKQSYDNSMSTSFMSLDESSGQCDVVTKPVTGEYFASIVPQTSSSGVVYSSATWNNVPAFEFNTTAYKLVVTDYKGLHF